MIPRVLTIAASDSSGAAGMQADLKTFEARQVYGLSALTAITAQNSLGLQSVKVLDPEFVLAQINAVFELGAGAVKTGLLLRAEIIEAVSQGLKQPTALIVDPVLVAGDGRQLVDEAAIAAYKTLLFPKALLITPNLYEAQILTGLNITDAATMCEASRVLYETTHPQNVLVKGGHLGGTEDLLDILYDGQTFHELRTQRLPVIDPRGAGDTYASCIAAEVAKGHSVIAATQIAQQYLTAAIGAAIGWQIGAGKRGLVYHATGRPPLH